MNENENKRADVRKIISAVICCILVPAVIVCGAELFKDKQYAWISLCVTILSCIPFALTFEKRTAKTGELALMASLAALSAAGRILFAPLPGFKPVTAFVIVSAMYLGPESGFAVGALSAVVSNFYFGQGPWTPFQMFAWGIIGFIAGLLSEPLKRSKVLMIIYGIIGGAAFSLIMDIWVVLWADGEFNPGLYITSMLSALPFTIIYAVSNIVFLLILSVTIGKILTRIKKKYGV